VDIRNYTGERLLNAYYARRAAVKKKAYDFIEVLRLNCEHGAYGPW